MKPERFDSHRYLAGTLIGNGGALVCYLLLATGVAGAELAMASLALSLFGAVVILCLVYRMWHEIEGEPTTISPRRAVTGLLVPLFNLYWVFRVVPGWAAAFEAYQRAREVATGVSKTWVKPNRSLLIAWVLASWVPGIGVLVACIAIRHIGRVIDSPRLAASSFFRATAPGESAESARPTLLLGLGGTYRGAAIPVDATGFVIGSDPAQAHLILAEASIKPAHARVWRDASGRTCVEGLELGVQIARGAGTTESACEPAVLERLSPGDRLRIGEVELFEAVSDA